MTTRDFKFDGQGLIPAIVQDWLDGTVLMLGYMNEALTKTLSTNSVHFLEPLTADNMGKG